MVKLLLVTFLFFTVHVNAQDTTIKYLDADLIITPNIEDAAFIANIAKANNGWYAKIFYGRENIAMEGIFKDKKLTIRNGLFKFYYASTSRIMKMVNYDYNVANGHWQSWFENGKPKDSGRKYYGKLIGRWKYWNENGQLFTYSKYADSFATPSAITKNIAKENRPQEIANYLESYFTDIKIGLWETYYNNGQKKDSVFYDNNGNKNGTAKAWFKNGKLEYTGNYQDDKETGIWKWYYENGNLATEEVYKNGKVTTMQCFDSTGKYISDYCSLSKPAIFPGGITKFEEYITKNIQYPKEALQTKFIGIVKAQFIVDVNGKVIKVVFEPTYSIYFNKEVERVLYNMPAWEPAIFHNRAVEYTVSLSVPFITATNY